jgi:hypothetical protein
MCKWFAKYPNKIVTEDDADFNKLESGITAFGINSDHFNNRGSFFVDDNKFEFFYLHKINKCNNIIQFKRAHTDIYRGKKKKKIESRNFGYKTQFLEGFIKVLLSIRDDKYFIIEVEGDEELIIYINGDPLTLNPPPSGGKIILKISELIESGGKDV